MGRTINSKWNRVGNIDPKRFALQLNAEMNRRADLIMEIAIRDIAEQVLQKSDEYVPEDEGDLRDSGRVDVVEKRGNSWYAEVVYGNSEVNYAFFVENDIPRGVEKNYTRSGSGAFFLQRAGDETLTVENFNAALRLAARKIGG